MTQTLPQRADVTVELPTLPALVVGRVLTKHPEPQKNGRTINWCTVDVGDANGSGEPQGVVCGAHNFDVGDLVVVVLPGGVLTTPQGPLPVSARRTYGHVSAGMICSERELGIGDDHDGILVLPADAGSPGDDALDALGLRDAVLDVAVTTDRGYCLSIRGLAREAAAAPGWTLRRSSSTSWAGSSRRAPRPPGRP